MLAPLPLYSDVPRCQGCLRGAWVAWALMRMQQVFETSKLTHLGSVLLEHCIELSPHGLASSVGRQRFVSPVILQLGHVIKNLPGLQH